jgi:hypothetical protein
VKPARLFVRARWHFAIAAVLSLGWVVLELAGQRENVAFLSGTLVAPEQATLGLVYMASWFGLVLVAPVFGLTGLLTLASDLARSRVAEGRAPWSLRTRDEVPKP